MKLFIPDTAAMETLGYQLSQGCHGGEVIFLSGELGMGKTTLTRGFLRGLGYRGNVKSPTYTIVEPYELGDVTAYHFDFYRLRDPEELDYLGVRDYFTKKSICLIEWPEKCEYGLPAADLTCYIAVQQNGRVIDFQPATEVGEKICKNQERK